MLRSASTRLLFSASSSDRGLLRTDAVMRSLNIVLRTAGDHNGSSADRANGSGGGGRRARRAGPAEPRRRRRTPGRKRGRRGAHSRVSSAEPGRRRATPGRSGRAGTGRARSRTATGAGLSALQAAQEATKVGGAQGLPTV
eukprot:9104740-Alexandrium_andersonii.AAC.1